MTKFKKGVASTAAQPASKFDILSKGNAQNHKDEHEHVASGPGTLAAFDHDTRYEDGHSCSEGCANDDAIPTTPEPTKGEAFNSHVL